MIEQRLAFGSIYLPKFCSETCDEIAVQRAARRSQGFAEAKKEHTINNLLAEANVPQDVWRGRLTLDELPRLYTEARQAGGVDPSRYAEIIAIVRDYVDSPDSGGVVYLYGDKGVGKTWIVQCAVARAVRNHIRPAIFTTHEDILAAVKDAFGEREASEHDALARFTATKLLGIDDLGRRAAATEWELTTLLRVIDERYRFNRPMILSSNYDLNALAHIWGSHGEVHAHTAKLICDRLGDAKKALHIKMAGRSLRKEK
jgi:DNA replication protein DnaC